MKFPFSVLLVASSLAVPLHASVLSRDTIAATDSTVVHHRNGELKKRLKHTGSIIYRFIKNFDSYDTTYIAPNYYNFTAMVQNVNYFQTYRLQARDEESNVQAIFTKPDPSVKIGPYFGWRWIFLGYTFDVAHPQSLGKSSELSFRLYSSMLGCDFVYMRNDGGYCLRKAVGFDGVEPKSVRGTSFEGMNSSTLSFSAYYVFNHRHFSYPATYNQSTQQLKSCGSPMAGFGYSRQNVSFDYRKLPAELLGEDGESKLLEGLKFSSINYDYYYLSGGYAYNWVFARNWVIGGSVMPSIGIRKAKGKKLKGNELLLDLKNLSLDCTSRFGLVWNNSKWFAGASYINHLYTYRNTRLSLTNSINYCNVYVGCFFGRKKK